MAEKIKLDLNLMNAQGQSAESVERLEERERVLTLLHSFYQERQKNMPVHREIGELAEKLRGLFERAGFFYKEFYNAQIEIIEEFRSRKSAYRNEIWLQWKQGENTSKSDTSSVIIILSKILNDELNLEPAKKEEKSEIAEIIENLKNIELKLNENVKKLWEIREKTAKELILTIPEFADFKDAELVRYKESSGLYNLDSAIWAEKTFETGIEERIIVFELNSLEFKNNIEGLKLKFNITEEELREIKDLKWSAEEKENLKNLMEDVGEYKAESEKLKQGLLKSANLKFKERGANLVKDEFIRAFVRQSYEDYKLPIIHKERVVQEIMNGTFSF